VEGPGTSVELRILPTHLHTGENGSHECLCTEEWVELLRGVNGSIRTQTTEVGRKTLKVWSQPLFPDTEESQLLPTSFRLGVVDPLDKLFQIGLGISKGLVFFEIGITIFFGAKQTLRGSGEQHTRICFGNTLHKAAFYGKRGARGTQLENQRSFRIMDTCAECTLQGASSLSVCL